MKNSKLLMVQAGVLPKLKLGVKQAKGGVKSTGSHKVKILEDKIVKGLDAQTGKEIDYVEYILEENGEKKFYRTKVKNKEGKLNYLVQHLSEVKEGEEVFMEMKKQGMKNYIEVRPLLATVHVEAEEEMDSVEIG